LTAPWRATRSWWIDSTIPSVRLGIPFALPASATRAARHVHPDGGLVGIGVSVDAADSEPLLVLHALPAVLSSARAAVGKGGHKSDEALVAGRFLARHAPPNPDQPKWAINGGRPRSRQAPRTTQQRRFMLRSGPRPDSDHILTGYATATDWHRRK
jgi:hypothetical protein